MDNTLEQVVQELKDYLQKWYDEVKTIPAEPGYKFGKIKSLWASDLGIKKREFFAERPELKSFEWQVVCDFEIVPGSYVRGGCICGDCEYWDHARVTGVKVEQVDWASARRLAIEPIKLESDYVCEKKTTPQGQIYHTAYFQENIVHLYQSDTLTKLTEKRKNESLR